MDLRRSNLVRIEFYFSDLCSGFNVATIGKRRIFHTQLIISKYVLSCVNCQKLELDGSLSSSIKSVLHNIASLRSSFPKRPGSLNGRAGISASTAPRPKRVVTHLRGRPRLSVPPTALA